MITVKSADKFKVVVEEDGKVNQDLGLLEAEEIIQILPLIAQSYAGQVEVRFQYGGYKMLTDVKEKACELAGFSGFSLVKAMAGEKVNF